MIEVIFQVRKDEFRDHEAVSKDLDQVEEEDQFTHLITLDDAKDSEDILNIFSLTRNMKPMRRSIVLSEKRFWMKAVAVQKVVQV
jgi:hypothetical protein